jgi:hypothetical protein
MPTKRQPRRRTSWVETKNENLSRGACRDIFTATWGTFEYIELTERLNNVAIPVQL